MESVDKQSLTILYVDDEEINLDLFKSTFKKTFNIITEKSAKEGLEILVENKIFLVVTDYRMPNMNGVKFIEEIEKESPDKICIIVTGFSDSINEVKEDLVYKLVLKP
jgi:YesN/AraC family two-component response regulator